MIVIMSAGGVPDFSVGFFVRVEVDHPVEDDGVEGASGGVAGVFRGD